MRSLHYTFTILLMSITLLGSCNSANSANNEERLSINTSTPPPDDPSDGKQIEMVFCLDATGSMSGLIGTAKEKIWAIVSEVAQGTDVASLELGMVFYRDRSDIFTTKPIPLTNDLDSVYSELLAINAAGGGDTPESVNQALNEAVTQMTWSESKDVYKTIFVVGDCPPHMDYQDDVSYLESCKVAAKKGITINTIKLGNGCLEAIPHFKKMAECSNGEFLQLDQDANDIVIATPFDNEINEVSKKIDESRMYYGSASEQSYNYTKKANSVGIYSEGSVTSNSDRSTYKNSEAGQKAWMGNKEMITDYSENNVELEKIPEKELPEELKDKTLAEKKAILDKLKAEREANKSKLAELSKKRQEFINAEKKARGEESSFSKEVVEIMNKQADR